MMQSIPRKVPRKDHHSREVLADEQTRNNTIQEKSWRMGRRENGTSEVSSKPPASLTTLHKRNELEPYSVK